MLPYIIYQVEVDSVTPHKDLNFDFSSASNYPPDPKLVI